MKRASFAARVSGFSRSFATVIGFLTLLTNQADAVDVLAKAAAAEPYGVATLEIPIGVPVTGRTFPPLQVSDDTGRVLYQVSHDVQVEVGPASERPLPAPGGGRLLNRVGELVRELASDGEPVKQTVARRVSFLFLGAQPLPVNVSDGERQFGTYGVVPQSDAALHAELLDQWWSGFTEATRVQIESADYPTFVESFLLAMLSGRTDRPLPDWFFDDDRQPDQLVDTLQLIGGGEAIGKSIFRSAAAGAMKDSSAAMQPLPASPLWKATEIPGDLSEVQVEPIAHRVPPECFYIRYGSFQNFLWFRDLSDEHGGDITRMLTMRGIEHNSMLRIETQLAMRMTQLSRMLGSTVIEDQALIGRDLFLNDGPSMGVLIRARNMFLLQTSVNGDRRAIANADPAVTLRDVQVAGRAVSLLSSADHRIRSFMAIDGEFMLVTNSRSILERFFEVSASGESLASSPAFRLARQRLPLARNDTIFAYFSPQMLQGLLSPPYLIELRRRLYAKSDVTIVHLARRAAALEAEPAEGSFGFGIEELAELGFLPDGFGSRADGSGAVTVGTDVLDTLRGRRGTFLPIADVRVDNVTAEEAAWYASIAEAYSSRFPGFDPLMVAIQREIVDPAARWERLTLRAEISPWDPGKYGKWSEQLGPPTGTAMQFAPDDIVTAQAHVASAMLGPPTHLFAAIKDSLPPRPEAFNGFLGTYVSLRQIPGYLGAWPQPGALDRLPLGLGRGQPVAPGTSRLIGGLYRYTDGQYSVISFDPVILRDSLNHLAATETENTAQVRLQIGNLYGSQLQAWVNEQLYVRTLEASAAGASYLEMLTQQLQIDPSDVVNAAEQILDGRIQCPLGGTYEPSPTIAGRWVSTAWGGEAPPSAPPDGFVTPLLRWFRGANASLTQTDDGVTADAIVDMQRR